MRLLAHIRRLFGEDTIYECRRCGTTLESDLEECPICGTREIAGYDLQ